VRGPLIISVVLALALAGCGGGSEGVDEVTPAEAAKLLDRKSSLDEVACSKREGSHEFDFTCTGRVDGTPITLVINVSSDEEAIASTSCRSEDTPTGNPCENFR
jgi:hypothetical protein